MHRTSKGIYMKFRALKNGKGSIANVTYENVYIDRPSSWPIWIGPAQQGIKEATGPYNPCHGDPCSLCWPVKTLMTHSENIDDSIHFVFFVNSRTLMGCTGPRNGSGRTAYHHQCPLDELASVYADVFGNSVLMVLC